MSQDHSAPLIPRRVLFGNPDKAMARISPDGRHISYLAPVDGVLNVWVAPVDDVGAAKPVTKDAYRGIRFYLWAYTNEHILYIQDRGGDENWRLYGVRLGSGEIRELTPFEGVQARIQHVSLKFPDTVLIGLNHRDPQLHDIHRLNINTGEMDLVQENPGFVGFETDDDYNIRLGIKVTSDSGSQILKPTQGGEWQPFLKIAMEDSLTTEAIGFDRTGKVLFMVDSRDRDAAGLFAMNPETGERRLLAEDARADVDDVMRHPVEGNVQAAAFTYERKEWQVIDDSIADDLAYLRTVADGDVEVVSRSAPDDQTWVVVYVMDDGPVRYYLYDRGRRRTRFLFTDRKALEDVALSKMRPVVVRARDGLDLVGYCTLPLGSDRDGDGRPDEPLPMVLLVHGGPWDRDSWGYDLFHQWLANRGYAVLSVNFRASTGFGKAFLNAGNLEWGAKMHDDLIDAVDWAITEGIADPHRVAIMGESYGGYATLAGLTFTPEKFACGVDIVGPSNLVTLLETIPPYWAPEIELFTTRIGDHRREDGRAFLKERSPLTFAGKICRPLLIGQGANDPRVKQAESDQIVGAMQENGIPVTYVLYPDEGHGFERPENLLSFNAIAEAFLAECLKGRCESVGDDFEGSTITVPVGREGVPGLIEALSDA